MIDQEYVLSQPPLDERKKELWLQHAAGFILFRDVRGYALKRIDPKLDDAGQAAARKAVDDAMYGLMMVLDGVTGGLNNEAYDVHLTTTVELLRRSGEQPVERIDPTHGDGMCMGFHGWVAGDFGDYPILEKVDSP